MQEYPNKEGLYDPNFEHDACGIGAIAQIKGIKTHKTIKDALDILIHLAKLKNKRRVVYEISELLSLDNEKYQTNKLYEFDGRSLVKCGALKNQRKLD